MNSSPLTVNINLFSENQLFCPDCLNLKRPHLLQNVYRIQGHVDIKTESRDFLSIRSSTVCHS